MREDTSRPTRLRRDAYTAVRQACAAPVDSIRLREEISDRTPRALPADACEIRTCDPEVRLLSHVIDTDYPECMRERFYAEVYPHEGALQFVDNACAKVGAHGRKQLVAKLFVGAAATRVR